MPWPIKSTDYTNDDRPSPQAYKVTNIFNSGTAIRVEPIIYLGDTSYTLPYWFIDVSTMTIHRNLTGETLINIRKIYSYEYRNARDLHTCACDTCKPHFDNLRRLNTPGYYKLY